MARGWLTVVLVAALLGAAPAVAQDATGGERDAVVILVRHAETAPDGTRDPGLSAEGTQRAARLAAMLAEARLDAVYTTDYLRTRGTAAAVAERLEIEPRVYDPSRLETFAEALRTAGGRVLVVGHSNTTPALVTALGGEAGAPIAESEHDRLYVLVLDGEETRTVLLRY